MSLKKSVLGILSACALTIAISGSAMAADLDSLAVALKAYPQGAAGVMAPSSDNLADAIQPSPGSMSDKQLDAFQNRLNTLFREKAGVEEFDIPLTAFGALKNCSTWRDIAVLALHFQ